jgi:hypothetical protein
MSAPRAHHSQLISAPFVLCVAQDLPKTIGANADGDEHRDVANLTAPAAFEECAIFGVDEQPTAKRRTLATAESAHNV